jgi:hypothetical protein
MARQNGKRTETGEVIGFDRHAAPPQASPTAAIIDSQSVKSAEKGGLSDSVGQLVVPPDCTDRPMERRNGYYPALQDLGDITGATTRSASVPDSAIA